jgi:hypothetical protein
VLDTDWKEDNVAANVSFDNSTNGFVATQVQAAIEESRSKSGTMLSTAFTGTPKKATVVFSNAFSDINYSISIIGIDRRSWSIETITTSGFIINSGANQALTDKVYWTASKNWG